jgi:hypothetical protein
MLTYIAWRSLNAVLDPVGGSTDFLKGDGHWFIRITVAILERRVGDIHRILFIIVVYQLTTALLKIKIKIKIWGFV